MSSQDGVNTAEEYILGLEGTPIYTKRWFPADTEPEAYIVFVHGFAEHVNRYDHYFRKLAAAPHNLHVLGYDQRGHGKTSHEPLTAASEQFKQWKNEGKTVKLEKGMKHRSGGWAKQLLDVEFMVQRESERANGKPLFLYGHSMGGALSLGFCTRKQPPCPSPDSVKLLSGIIASGPFLRQTTPNPAFQVYAGKAAVFLGLGSFVIPTPLDVKHFTHDVEIQEKTENDPFCAPYGSLLTIKDMLNFGTVLDSREGWENFPKDLPLLIFHGGEDPVADPKAAVRFGEKVVANDKTVKVLEGLLHEPHNETAPEPQKLSDLVSDWIHAHMNGPKASAKL